MIQAQFQLRELACGVLLGECLIQVTHAFAGLVETQSDLPQQAGDPIVDTLHQFIDIGGDRLGGNRGRRGAQIGNEIGYGEVDFMPHTRHQWNRAGDDIPRQRLVIEAPQVLE